MTTASEISVASDGQVTSDVLLLGAAGNSGRLIAAELASRGLSVRLAGRRRGPLEDLAGEAAQRFHDSLTAPSKQLAWFESSAHTPHLEEPAKFRDLLMNVRASQLTST